MIDVVSLLLLLLTIVLGTGRNMLSKKISDAIYGCKQFYLLQAFIFFSGAAILLFFSDFSSVSGLTVIFSLIYALFLVLAQWCYTVALGKIKVSICSTIYSLGFIIPTLFGALFIDKNFTVYHLLGLMIVVIAIFFSGNSKKMVSKEEETKKGRYFVALAVSMLASGGLGVVQKLQQSSKIANERGVFIIIAFLVAALISLVFALAAKSSKGAQQEKRWVPAVLTGVCFGCCNLLNTTLAGRLDSAVFFPLQNISVILFSVLLSCICSKEKVGRKELVVLGLGITAIILLNMAP